MIAWGAIPLLPYPGETPCSFYVLAVSAVGLAEADFLPGM